MAETTEIAVEASGFDKLTTQLASVEKASEGTRKALRNAFATEVLTQGIDRIGHAIGGVEGAAVSAAGNLAKGFMAGGPVGLAIAATTVAFESLFKVIDYGNEKLKEQDAIMEKIAIERVERAGEVRRAEAAAQKAAIDALERTNAADTDAFLDEQKERQRRRKEQREQDAKDSIEATTREIEGVYNQKRAQTAIEEEEFQRFLRESTAMIQSDARAKADAEKRAVDARTEQAARLADLQAFADEATAITDELTASLVAQADATSDAIGRTVGEGASQAVSALVAMDAAQIAAAASAGTLASSLAAAAATGISAQLQAIAQRETVEALAAAAMGFGRLAMYDAKGAGESFTSAGLHAAAAVAAGAGAVALNTAASAVAPPAAARAPQSQAQGGGSRGGGSGGGGTTIIVNTDRLFATEADIGESVERSRKQYERYRGY